MHVILDGKTLRGTQQHLAEDQKNMRHVNLYEAKTGIVLKGYMVAEKEGELTQVKAFLTPPAASRTYHQCRCPVYPETCVPGGYCFWRRLPPLCKRDPTRVTGRLAPLL